MQKHKHVFHKHVEDANDGVGVSRPLTTCDDKETDFSFAVCRRFIANMSCDLRRK